MNQKSLRVLEFNKIIELLKSKASSSLGLKYIEELVPSSDYEEVKYMQQETSETQSILTKREREICKLENMTPEEFDEAEDGIDQLRDDEL